jgi:hypothetical protein
MIPGHVPSKQLKFNMTSLFRFRKPGKINPSSTAHDSFKQKRPLKTGGVYFVIF